jgi:uncharacterized protein
MRRRIYNNLLKWKSAKNPKPIILRGARQVGKTYLVEDFAKNEFQNFVKINFEQESRYKSLFDDLNPKKILEVLSIQKNIDIEIGKTLIFFDEIQDCPKAIQCLRYFYEEFPGLHVIATGSLLEFIINSEDFKFPVGRVSFFYLKPFSFYEFLEAIKEDRYINFIREININRKTDPLIHDDLLKLLRLYFLIGGMPAAINTYLANINDIDGGLKEAFSAHSDIVEAYRSDFGKYSQKVSHGDLQSIIQFIPKNLAKKFKYSKVYPEAKSNKIKNAFDLLVYAGLIQKILCSSGELPLGAIISEIKFKAIFLDIGLALSIYDYDYQDLLSENFWTNISGGLTEQFVGQELLSYSDPQKPAQLYYWERASQQSSAEIDYLINVSSKVWPIEVKSGKTGRLKSLHMFREKFSLPFGIRFSTRRLELENGVLSIPLYAVGELERLIELGF